MNTSTLIQMHPDDIRTMLAEVLKQAAGMGTAANAITPEELPYLSARDAATYLGCSVAHLAVIVQRWPDKLKPVIVPRL